MADRARREGTTGAHFEANGSPIEDGEGLDDWDSWEENVAVAINRELSRLMFEKTVPLLNRKTEAVVGLVVEKILGMRLKPLDDILAEVCQMHCMWFT